MPINHSLRNLLFFQGSKRVLKILGQRRSPPIYNQPLLHNSDSMRALTLIFHCLFCGSVCNVSHVLSFARTRWSLCWRMAYYVASYFPKAQCLVSNSFPVIPQPSPGMNVQPLLKCYAPIDLVHALILHGHYHSLSLSPRQSQHLYSVLTALQKLAQVVSEGAGIQPCSVGQALSWLLAATPESEPFSNLHGNLVQVSQ